MLDIQKNWEKKIKQRKCTGTVGSGFAVLDIPDI